MDMRKDSHPPRSPNPCDEQLIFPLTGISYYVKFVESGSRNAFDKKQIHSKSRY